MLKKLISNVLLGSFLLFYSCQGNHNTSNFDNQEQIIGIGLAISVELGFFKKGYQEYFKKTLNGEKLTEKERMYSNIYDFDEHYKFANITILCLYSDSEKTNGDTIHIIYPLLSHSGRQSTDISVSKSYAFNAKPFPKNAIEKTTLSGNFQYYISQETTDILPIYYPVKDYHLLLNNDIINNTVDSILSIVKL